VTKFPANLLVTWTSVRPWLGTVIRLLLGVLWLWSGWAKLHDPRAFVQVVRAYDATPEWLSKSIGYGLPILEICLGLLLVVGVAVRLAAAVSAVLFLVFLIGLAQAAARGLQLTCGCFHGGGITAGPTQYTLDILRDVALLLLAAYLAVWSMTRISIEEFLARNDYVPPPSAKRLRSHHGQRKYSAAVEARRKEARERNRYLNASVAVVVVLIAVIGAGVQSGRAKIAGSLVATHAGVTNGIVYGKKAAATVDIFEDFMCPACERFESSAGAALAAEVRANKAQVRFHELAFLNANSNGTRYSSRSANAAVCASDVSVDAFKKFHDILFKPSVQPKEGSNGLADSKFITYAQQAGLTTKQVTTFSTCVQQENHKALVLAMTDDASKRAVTQTPTVRVNGKTLSNANLASLRAAIAAADAKGPPPSPSPTPSATPPPTPTPSSSTAKK
jgi:protein-disulfide isomerase/uncharacterized membrane protein YphA (DoxX/SURF4 family)